MYWRNWWFVKCSVFCRNITLCAHCATCRVKCLDVLVCIYVCHQWYCMLTVYELVTLTQGQGTQLVYNCLCRKVSGEFQKIVHHCCIVWLLCMHTRECVLWNSMHGYPVRICVAEFGHVVLCMYVCMCVYMWPKRLPVWGLTTWNSPIGKTYCSLIEFNHQKRHLQCQTIHSGKEIWKHFINEVGESQEFQNIVLRYAMHT